jgi:peptidyl-prolyl cis-trans isomerase SurA
MFSRLPSVGDLIGCRTARQLSKDQIMKQARTLSLLFSSLLIGIAGTSLTAQQSGSSFADRPSAGQVEVVGRPSDPRIRKAAAIVNGSVVTDLDVDQRLNLALAASGTRLPPEEQARLRAQVLRNLIDEKIQIAEAKEHEVTVEDAQVSDYFNQVSRNFRQTPDQFAEFLKTNGSSKQSLLDQIKAEMAWSRLLRRRVEPLVNVGDDEVNSIIGKLKASKGKDEYRLSEIFLPATTENEADVLNLANRILEQIKRGGSFVVFARQYSEASTAAVGGDRGWVSAAQLDSSLANSVSGLNAGQIAGPIRAPGGYYLLLLNEKRKTLAANPLDSVLTLKQVSIPFGEGITQDQADAIVQKLAVASRGTTGCGRAEEMAAPLKGKVSDLPPTPIKELPEGLHKELEGLKIGQPTQPFGTARDARVLILCGRDDAQEAEPNYDEVYAQLNEQRVGLMARRYLRDLRRDAVVDYR